MNAGWDQALLPGRLAVGVYQVTLEALEPVELAAFAAGTLRGAFGWTFKRLVCYQPQVKTCQGCLLRGQCPYPQVFEPAPQPGTLYAELQNVPAPYVLRPPAGQERFFQPGQRFAFQVVLVGRAIGLLPYFAVALQQLESSGVGRTQGRARLAALAALHPDGAASAVLYSRAAPDLIHTHRGWPAAQWVAGLGKDPAPHQASVEFLTPTRLISDGRMQIAPDFHVLYRALLRRVDALCTYHSDERWPADFVGLASQARQVSVVARQTRPAQQRRYSSRQASVVELHGCTGRMVYAGDLAPFWPLLQLGEILHVGKGCTFGLGRYRLAAAG